ncbi:glucose dehydrogenase [Pseudomonas matsuisoli]|uniref:Glucose dehydrogenase n=1 Tax=Pseudomonas matsuisoli TaxID=1515666 RepID=A0A917PVB6_9PSED|nr:glucose dehydrogenase [Pseudomonas matsuisoli]
MATLVLLFGLAFTAGGAWLAWLGGSWYYVIAGIALLATAVALYQRRRIALALYGGFWLGTLAWSVWEVGLDTWPLEARLLLPTFLGLYLFMPHVIARLGPRRKVSPVGYVLCPLAAVLVVLGLMFVRWQPFPQSLPTPRLNVDMSTLGDPADWPRHDRNERGERWSPLTQVDQNNVTLLQEAWRFRSVDLPRPGENADQRGFSFDSTPIKVGNSLYFCTPHRQVISVDAVTGQERWRFDPGPESWGDSPLSCRGVAYYETERPRTSCPQRIFSTTGDGRLVALDAGTGQPCQGFGERGFVALNDFSREHARDLTFQSSVPFVAGDRVVIGGWGYAGRAANARSGAVRAFDALTGRVQWAWDVSRSSPSPAPAEQPSPTGSPPATGLYTADLARGLLYLPIGNAVPAFYGGKRAPAEERYASSLVALDIASGEPRWHFQTLRHDLWSLGVAVGPTLIDVPAGDGKTTPALLQTTKRGELFLLNRENGEPLSQVVERPAPPAGLPEDPTAATQPYSPDLPSLAPPVTVEEDAWGVTPFDQLLCRIDYRRMRYVGMFTPPQPGRKTLYSPGTEGVFGWQGGAYDPERGLFYSTLRYMPYTVELLKREEAEAAGILPVWDGTGEMPKPRSRHAHLQYGTPYVAWVKPWLGLFGAPCKAPPWGQLLSLDLTENRIAWRHNIGSAREYDVFGYPISLPLRFDPFDVGGTLLTRAGLLFVGSRDDNALRAFAAGSGRQLWKTRLPAGARAAPMTYIGNDGRQYIVVAGSGLGEGGGDYLIAYALP